MSQALAFLIWLLCVGISAVLIGYFIKTSYNPVKKEGFAVYTCPKGTNSFVTNGGYTQCCNGDIVDGYCTGDVRCTLSPKDRSGLPTCSELAASDAAAAGANQCPAQMPNYFASSTLRGCSASQATADGTAPSNPNQPQCILYATRDLDLVKLDSCYNVLENARKASQCATAQATANLPACQAAAASTRPPAAPAAASCPVPSFVITGDWVGGRFPVEKKYVMGNRNNVYAIQGGTFTKMVVTDMNNITITARYYNGLIAELDTRAADMAKVNALSDATGHYLLSTAP